MTPNELIIRLEKELEALPYEQCCQLIGELERAKARLWSRFLYGRSAPSEKADSAPLLTVDQVAERLHLPKARVYELIRQGKLPAMRIGKHVRVEVARLDRWIADNSS